MSFTSPALLPGKTQGRLEPDGTEPRRETQNRVLVNPNQVVSLAPEKEQYQQVRGSELEPAVSSVAWLSLFPQGVLDKFHCWVQEEVQNVAVLFLSPVSKPKGRL